METGGTMGPAAPFSGLVVHSMPLKNPKALRLPPRPVEPGSGAGKKPAVYRTSKSRPQLPEATPSGVP
jgi:hypothetical protein